jgi:hypothetical protein
MKVYKKIDWFYWSNMKSVSIMDATLLACNINPNDKNPKLNETANQLYNLIDSNRIDRKYFSNVYEHNQPKIILSELASWCAKINYPIPDELKALAKPNTLELENKNINENLNEKERNTLLNLILGMAIDGYGYQVNDNRSALTGTTSDGLSATLKTHGIDISHKTIKKYLTEAKEKCMQNN